MIPSEPYLRRLANALVDEIVKKDLVELSGDVGVLRDRFLAVLSRNFADEDQLERDAEAFADAHRREMAGMDRSRFVTLVKQRLAKERGFVL